MFKRARWMGMGFAAGVGTTIWANVKLKQRAERYTPAALGEEAARRVRRLSGDVRDALADGQRAMADREAQLRAAQGRVPAGAGAGGAGPAVPWTDHGHQRPSARLS